MPIPEGYSIPITAPLYEGPTYKYIHTYTILCVFRTTKEVMEKVVPKPLVYNSDLRFKEFCLGVKDAYDVNDTDVFTQFIKGIEHED